MRSGLVSLSLFLLAGAGCNSIFGSHDVINGSIDADLRPKDAAPYTMYVTGMSYDTTQQPMATPDMGMATFPALAGTTVKVGKLGEAPQSIGLDNLGAFSVPYDLAQGVYRIIYTPPDGVPVEIQGKLQTAHFVVPSIGRPDAVAAPSNAVVGNILPSGGPGNYQNLHLFAIGTYAVRVVGTAIGTGLTTNWTTNAAQVDAIQSMSGGLDTPEGAKGDRLVAIDGMTGDPNTAFGFTVGTMQDFSSGFVNPTFTPWKTTTDVGVQMMQWGYAASQADTSMRLTAATSTNWMNDIDDGNGLGYVPPFVYGGVLPTTKLPNFVEPGQGYPSTPANRWAARGQGGLGMPIYLPLSKATASVVSMVHAFNGSDLPAFRTAMFVRYSRSGTVEGARLTAGIQTIALADNTTPTNVPVSVGLAYTPTQHITLNGADIWLDNGPANPIPNAPAEMDLVFDVDKPTTTDDCISTIYELDNNTVVPVHRFISTPNNVQVNATIQVDKSIFAAGHDYVIGISCHQGLPGVATALDWSHVAYPFSESVTWSHPFNVP